MASLSTHVLDTSVGRPAAGVRVTLESLTGTAVGEGVTDADGRIAALGPVPLAAGDYRLSFDTGSYHRQRGTAGFYPEVVITFSVEGEEHFHVPLLLNPYGYSTYRGS
jgi:5-hydroxyisourate hydrolase